MVAGRHLRIARGLHNTYPHAGYSYARLLGRRRVYVPSAQVVVSVGSLGLLVLWHSWLGTSKALRRYQVDDGLAEKMGQLPA